MPYLDITAKDRAKKFREKMKADGFKNTTVWIPLKRTVEFKEIVKAIREGKKIKIID